MSALYDDLPDTFDDPVDESTRRELATMEVGDREVKCTQCFMVHRADLACEEAW